MSEHLSLIIPAHQHRIEVLAPELKPAPADVGAAHLTPEQLQAQDAVFQQDADSKEAQQVAGLLGMWSGTLLLHDLVAEHLEQPVDEELTKWKKRGEENAD